MRYLLFIFLFVGISALAQDAPRIVPIGSSRAIDTNYSKGNMRIDSSLRLSKLATSDTNIVAGFDSKGNIVPRVKGSGGGGSGTVTSISTSAPLTGGTITTSGTIGMTQAGLAANGWLSSADFTTFSNKLNAADSNTLGGYMTRYYNQNNTIDYSNGVEHNYLDASGNELMHVNKLGIWARNAAGTTGVEYIKDGVNYLYPSGSRLVQFRGAPTGSGTVLYQSGIEVIADSGSVWRAIDSVAGLVPSAPSLQAVTNVDSVTTTGIYANKFIIGNTSTTKGIFEHGNAVIYSPDLTKRIAVASSDNGFNSFTSQGGSNTNTLYIPSGTGNQGWYLVQRNGTDTVAGQQWVLDKGYTTNTGTVTDVNAGYGITGGNITTSGTHGVDSLLLATKLLVKKQIDSIAALISSSGSTSIDTTHYITGGDFVTSSTTFVPITGLSTGVLGLNKGYAIDIWVDCVPSTTAGLRVTFRVTPSPDWQSYHFWGVTSNPTLAGFGAITNGAENTTWLISASVTGNIHIQGTFYTGNTGSPVGTVEIRKLTSGTATAREKTSYFKITPLQP